MSDSEILSYPFVKQDEEDVGHSMLFTHKPRHPASALDTIVPDSSGHTMSQFIQQVDARGSHFNNVGRDQHNHCNVMVNNYCVVAPSEVSWTSTTCGFGFDELSKVLPPEQCMNAQSHLDASVGDCDKVFVIHYLLFLHLVLISHSFEGKYQHWSWAQQVPSPKQIRNGCCRENN